MSEICFKLHVLFNQLPRFRFPFDSKSIPLNGIYILFEEGEFAHGVDRIVRVGTHTGENQLRSRIEQHFMRENKDRSIFRKNIGRAILQKNNDSFLEQWELDLTTREAKQKHGKQLDMNKLKAVEGLVTAYIQSSLSFVIFQATSKNSRLSIESKLISSVSLCKECGPSKDWLGLHSPKEKIRESGLWIVNELYKQPLLEDEYHTFQRTILDNGNFS